MRGCPEPGSGSSQDGKVLPCLWLADAEAEEILLLSPFTGRMLVHL